MGVVERVLKEYNCRVRTRDIEEIKPRTSTEETAIDSKDEHRSADPAVWPRDVLPYTKYMREINEENLERIEKWRTGPVKLKNKLLVQTLTEIDLDLIQALTADDLINYDGHGGTEPILHIQNMNKALVMIFAKDCESRKLFSLLKHATVLKNWNLVSILINSLQNKKLSQKKFEKLTFYIRMLEHEDGGIFPLSWMLKDCEDSNLNVESEVASLRFCKLIEKLKEMKGIELEARVEEKCKQIVYSKAWDALRNGGIAFKMSKVRHDYLYLAL